MSLSFLVYTLGCKLNQLESEAFIDTFIQAGFTLCDSSNRIHPSIIVVNTCTVTSKADQKARRVIRKALRDFPDSLVLVTGCYAQLEKTRLGELDDSGRLFVLGGMGKDVLLDLKTFLIENGDDLRLAFESMCENVKEPAVDNEERSQHSRRLKSVFQFSPERFSSHTRSFLKIQDGCDNHCTYCRIRLARGQSVSLDAETVLERLRVLEKSHAEAVITGVNICQYNEQWEESGKRRIGNLGVLLDYLLAGTQRIALRLSSLEPDFIDESFAKTLSHARVRPHFHLSIQSCSEKILQRMGRSYNRQIIERAVSLLRGAKEDPFLACDIITGFPGESEAEFEETYELCKNIGFAWIHVFPYSKRSGTPAFSFKDTVQESEVTKRVKMFTDLAWQGRMGYVSRWLGREVDVLVERGAISNEQLAMSNEKRAVCQGISENYLKLLVEYNGETEPPAGTVLRCRLTKEREGDFDAVAREV